MSVVVFDRMPMPPQSNHAYATVMVGKFPKRVSSADLKQFQRDMTAWSQKHWSTVQSAKKALMPWGAPNRPLRVDRYFAFHEHRIWSKKNQPQMLDASNRVKSFDDELAKILGIDDKWFFSGVAEKVICPPDEPECALVVIQPTWVRTLEQVTSPNRHSTPYAVAASLAMEKEHHP